MQKSHASILSLPVSVSVSVSVYITTSILKTVLEADLGEAGNVGQRSKFNPARKFYKIGAWCFRGGL
jgi:hypothetical protein